VKARVTAGEAFRLARQLEPARLGDHLDRLYRAAWALTGSREDAEDLIQDTYARVLARPRFLKREDDIGYLLRVLRNTFLNTKRTERRRPRTEPMAEGFEPIEERGSTRPEDALEAKEVFEAVASLADDYRDVVVAVDVVGLSYAEAAAALRVPEGTIMSRLYRARQQIARGLA
jgi:RNA polymerase sigma-70 factor (ECF subfamily)